MTGARQRSSMNATKRADAVFAKAVRESGPCLARYGMQIERAFPTCNGNMQCAHVVTRTYRATRWRARLFGDPFDGAVPLCAAHHIWFTHRPIEWEEFCKQQGIDYALVRARALNDPPEKAVDALARLRSLEPRP